MRARPFRAPHHTVSDVALVGGGSNPRPGEISLAHHGVLFLDEMPEFSRHVLEVLRQPLEDGLVRISRAQRTAVFPARFVLVGAMNPCPCGFLGDPRRACRCTPTQIDRYAARLSGPLRDRIDLTVTVAALPPSELTSGERENEPTAAIRARVERARALQEARAETVRRHRSTPGWPGARCGGLRARRSVASVCSTTPPSGWADRARRSIVFFASHGRLPICVSRQTSHSITSRKRCNSEVSSSR